MLSRGRQVAAAVLTAATVLLTSGIAAATPASGPASAHAVRGAKSKAAIPGSYIVMLKNGSALHAQDVDHSAKVLSAKYHGKLGHVWTALHGFSVNMSASQAEKLAGDPAVDHVTQDERVAHKPIAAKRLAVAGRSRAVVDDSSASTTASAGANITPAAVQNTPPSWGLDRIDQKALPLDQHYSYDDSAGQGVRVYSISEGIDPNQPDLAGRVTLGPNFVNDQSTSADCVGEGTAEAGVIAGTTAGVAKKAQVVAVRVFGCNAVATATSIQDGFNWVINNAAKPALIMFDLQDNCVFPDGVHACDPSVANEYINAQESAFVAGIAVVAASGDSAQPNCVRSSGAAPDAIYVGATTQADTRAAFSDFGPCLTMWAPGDQIITDGIGGGQVLDSGTHLAAAHVAGAAALLLGAPEFASASPAQIRTALVTKRSTVVPGLAAGGSPNLLLSTAQEAVLTDGDSETVTSTNDGRLMLLGVNQQGHLTQQTQTAVGSGSWSVPLVSGTTGKSTGAGLNADGRVEMAVIAATGEVGDRSQTSPGSSTWSLFSTAPATPSGSPVTRVDMAHNASNRLQMFATDQQGNTYRRNQLGANSTSWGGWNDLGQKLRSITAKTDGNNRIELLGTDDAGRVRQAMQTSSTDDNWTFFTTLPGFAMADISAAKNSNGTLLLTGVDTGGNPWVRVQNGVGSTSWTNWSALPQKTLRDISAQTDTSNNLVRLVGVDNLGNVWQSQQTAVNSTSFGGWTQITGITLRP
ncbi:protease inhibitor I9 family protein [Streptomyces sp. NPDC059718]